MPGSPIPVLRQPFRAGDALPFWALGAFSGSHLYDLANDPAEERNLAGRPQERRAEEALRAALLAIEAPADQLERLGLATGRSSEPAAHGRSSPGGRLPMRA